MSPNQYCEKCSKEWFKGHKCHAVPSQEIDEDTKRKIKQSMEHDIFRAEVEKCGVPIGTRKKFNCTETKPCPFHKVEDTQPT